MRWRRWQRVKPLTFSILIVVTPFSFQIRPSRTGAAPFSFQNDRPASGNRVLIFKHPVSRRDCHFYFSLALSCIGIAVSVANSQKFTISFRSEHFSDKITYNLALFYINLGGCLNSFMYFCRRIGEKSDFNDASAYYFALTKDA